MYLARRLKLISVLTYSRSTSHITNSAKDEEITVPNRIHRSPTDILYALAATAGRDPTAPHYKYHDDPYLIPGSNSAKRSFALAQESGRKSAKWIRERHSDLFMHQEAQPPIKAFSPNIQYDENSELNAELLQDLIKKSELTDAVKVYQLMQDKGVAIENNLKQQLLELIAFYNAEEPDSLDYIEERWLKLNISNRGGVRKTWKDGDFAELLFNEIEPKNATCYAALIRGMAKYHQHERAYFFFREAVNKGLQLDTETYNFVIQIASFLRENTDQTWTFCIDLLNEMTKNNLQPNLGTMNALLHAISTFSNYKFGRNSALKVLAEFKNLGVKPSLGTYHYILVIFCRERGIKTRVLEDILHEIEGKEFSILHARDTDFFVTAMSVCRNHLQDSKLAKRIDALLHTGRNYDLIGSSYMEIIYYRHYLLLLCQTEPIEEFMNAYDLIVPHIASPEPGTMEEILKVVELNASIELVPRLWSDITVFGFNRESLLEQILRIMTLHKPNMDLPNHANLPEQFGKVALEIFNKLTQTEFSGKKLISTGEMFGDVLVLLARAQDFENAVQVFNYINKEQNSISGSPTETALIEFINECIRNKAPNHAISVAQYAADNNMDIGWFAKIIKEGFTLNEDHLRKLNALSSTE